MRIKLDVESPRGGSAPVTVTAEGTATIADVASALWAGMTAIPDPDPADWPPPPNLADRYDDSSVSWKLVPALRKRPPSSKGLLPCCVTRDVRSLLR